MKKKAYSPSSQLYQIYSNTDSFSADHVTHNVWSLMTKWWLIGFRKWWLRLFSGERATLRMSNGALLIMIHQRAPSSSYHGSSLTVWAAPAPNISLENWVFLLDVSKKWRVFRAHVWIDVVTSGRPWAAASKTKSFLFLLQLQTWWNRDFNISFY